MPTERIINDPALLEQIAEFTDQAMLILDAHSGKILYSNPATEVILSKTKEEINVDPKETLTFIFEEDRKIVSAYIKNIRNSPVKQGITCRLQAENLKWVTVTTFFLKSSSGKEIIVLFAQDITVIKENERHLLEYTHKKNTTLDILSHELATPLQVIKTLSTKMGSFQATSQEFTKSLALIKDTCNQSLLLIKNLVNQEFLETGKVKLNIERFDIIDRIRLLLEIYKKAEKVFDKNFELITDVEELYIFADENKLIQVLSNLISNAIKFTKAGGKIQIQVQGKKQSYLFTVKDNGIGIPEDLKPFIFDRLTKARRIGLNGEESVGLGLSIVKTIINLHEGKVYMESTENKGSSFFVEIPKMLKQLKEKE